jgi:hypothetical protein
MNIRRAVLWALLVAKAIAGIGVGWDIRWHIVIGRDSFWIAPHVMTYAGVAAAAMLSFGVLLYETWKQSLPPSQREKSPVPLLRIAGLVGSRGYHLAWWGIALTILAAPVDDLWHRLFGIDVTLWSPPHLLGLAGAQLNSLGCLLIARELWPQRSWASQITVGFAALLLLAGFQTGVDPSLRTAFLHGGVRFFTYALLGGLFFTFTLVFTARFAESRLMPLVVVLGGVAMQLAVIAVGDVGLAILQPQPAVAEAIAGDPGSPIAVAHEIARRNGTMPGRGFTVRLFPVLPALLLVMVDARRRPLAAGLTFGIGLYLVSGGMFLRSPAFAHVHPDVVDAVVAVIGTAVVTAIAAIAARVFEEWVTGVARARRPTATAAALAPRG